MVTAARFEDTIRRHNFLSAPYELYDNKSKFRDMSREYYVARDGDDSEMVFVYRHIHDLSAGESKQNMTCSRLGLSRMY